MKKMASHLSIAQPCKPNHWQKNDSISTPVSGGRPFFYKTPSLVSGIAQKKELYLKDKKTTIGSSRPHNNSNSKAQTKHSFRRKTETELDNKQTLAAEELKDRLNLLEGRLAEIKQGYMQRKQKNGDKSIKAESTHKNISISKEKSELKKIGSRKKLSLADRAAKQNNTLVALTVANGRLQVQSPKRLEQGAIDKKVLFKKEVVKGGKNSSLLDYVTQYQQPDIFKIPRNQRQGPQSTTNLSSKGISLRQTFTGGQKSSLAEKRYYISSVLNAMSTSRPTSFDQLCTQHINASFEFLSFVKREKLRMPMKPQRIRKLPRSSPIKKNTIIFDLDQTLIHCHDATKGPADVKLPVTFPDGTIISVSINLRPYARECLRELSKNFQIIVFTASHECYAKVVVEFLDPEGKHIEHFFAREDCFRARQGFYVKDLRVIDRDLSRLLLVDNAAYSYCFHPENGVPIVPFYDNKADLELKSLVDYLNKFISEPDVRELNSKTMRLADYSKFRNPSDLIKTLYTV